MPLPILLLVLGGSICAAAGQLMLMLGASGRDSLLSFANVWIAGGLIAYVVGTLLWVYALSKAALTVVYPFTALTFVFVYVSGIWLLGEPTSLRALAGVGLILAGLSLISAT